MLILIALILIGVAVIAGAAFAILRSSRPSRKTDAGYLDATRAEGEVYEQLYGKRSLTVSDPLPVEAPVEAEPDGPRSQPSVDPRPRSHRGSRTRDSHP